MQVKYFLIFSAVLFFRSALIAAPGDTTRVRAHNRVDMTWYQGYKAWGVFPAAGKSYHRIDLDFTIGCASSGCSDWDYTVTMYLLRPTGKMDSTIQSVDSISGDTAWRKFERKERYELARMITPYGAYMRQGSNGYNSQWKHTLSYDVTDFQLLLKDSVEFEVFYSGWSSGFSATLDFVMIEGTPARRVSAISKPWSSEGGSYADKDQFNNVLFPAKNLKPGNGVKQAWLRITATGHGFVNSINCAEFCKKDYYVAVNNTRIATQSMWRDDCGLNPIYPQGGTWLYDRANWCPGGKAFAFDYELMRHSQNPQDFTVNFDIEDYTVTVPAGETPPTYIIGNVLFEVDDIPHKNDVELYEILAPSSLSDHKRMNPRCGEAIVKIRNKGSEKLTSCVINYRIGSSPWHSYNWSGNLDFFGEATVTLPLGNSLEWRDGGDSAIFEARVDRPNGNPDEYALNDVQKSKFYLVPEYPRNIYLQLRTNNRGTDTWWKITRTDDGAVITQRDNLTPNTTYHDTLQLTPGCYEMVIGDRSKNGLGWWANSSDGNGFARLRGYGGAVFTKNFNIDFGTEIRDYFIIKAGLGIKESGMEDCLLLYPNPAAGKLNIEISAPRAADWNLKLLTISGLKVWEKNFTDETDINEQINTRNFAPGIYLLQAENGLEKMVKKVVIR